MFAFVGVTLTDNGAPLLHDFSCALAPGECVVIADPGNVGPALLSLLLGERIATSGAVEADNVNIRTLPKGVLQLYRQRIGTMFDEPRLLQDMTAVENVALPAELRGIAPTQARTMASALLAKLSMTASANLLPTTLTQRDRRIIAFARALCGSPPILALVEPFAGIDAPMRTAMLALLAEAKAANMTVLVMTAEPNAFSGIAQRIVTPNTAAVQAAAPVTTSQAAVPSNPAATPVKITAVSGS